MNKHLDRLVEVARDMVTQGHPGLASAILSEVSALEDIVYTSMRDNNVLEIQRLRAIIKNAIPHQTNGEVSRWLSAALQSGVPIYQNVNGKRIDQE